MGPWELARDSNGKVLIASCKEVHFLAFPFMLEACALRDWIINLLSSLKIAASSASIFDDCRLLASGFREILFKHCNREANEVAHELARRSFADLLKLINNYVTVFEIL
jgi:hypothetical protein